MTNEEEKQATNNSGTIFKILAGCALFVFVWVLVLGGLVYSQRKWIYAKFFEGHTEKAIKKTRERFTKEGGLHVFVRLSPTNRKDLEGEKLRNQVKEVIRNRLDMYGVTDGCILNKDNETIEVLFPGISEKEVKKLRQLVLARDLVAFHQLVENGQSNNAFELMGKKKPGETVLPGLAKPSEEAVWYLFSDKVLLGTTDLKYARIGFDSLSGKPKVLISCTEEGKKRLKEVTTKLIGKRMAIVIGGKVFMAPVIRQAIAGGYAEITGEFDIEEVRKVVGALKAGCLPCKITEVKE